MKINIISESQWFPGLWGGIHTAFLNYIRALRLQKVSLTVNAMRDADITYIHSFGIFGLYKLLTSRCPVITTHMTPETQAGTFRLGKIGYLATKYYLRFFYNKATLVIALSERVKKDLQAIGVTTKMVIIPNPIDSTLFHNDPHLRQTMRKKHGFQEADFIVISVGHAVARKGIIDFIELAKAMPDFTFIWVGGKLSDMIGAVSKEQEQAIKHAPKNFILTGRVPYNDVAAYYNMADVLLFPSYKEIASMVIIEAAACGLPILLRDLSEYHELYAENYLACSNNEAFQKGLQLLRKDKKTYTAMVAKSGQIAKAFTLETIGKRVLNQFERLLESR